MRTTLDIDERLMKEAMKAAELPTKKAAVEAGLRELIDAGRRMKLFEMGGEGYGMGIKEFIRSRRSES